jgi:hypothetical protein
MRNDKGEVTSWAGINMDIGDESELRRLQIGACPENSRG